MTADGSSDLSAVLIVRHPSRNGKLSVLIHSYSHAQPKLGIPKIGIGNVQTPGHGHSIVAGFALSHSLLDGQKTFLECGVLSSRMRDNETVLHLFLVVGRSTSESADRVALAATAVGTVANRSID